MRVLIAILATTFVCSFGFAQSKKLRISISNAKLSSEKTEDIPKIKAYLIENPESNSTKVYLSAIEYIKSEQYRNDFKNKLDSVEGAYAQLNSSSNLISDNIAEDIEEFKKFMLKIDLGNSDYFVFSDLDNNRCHHLKRYDYEKNNVTAAISRCLRNKYSSLIARINKEIKRRKLKKELDLENSLGIEVNDKARELMKELDIKEKSKSIIKSRNVIQDA